MTPDDLDSSEPLYQTYRATVITQEIRRQTVSRNISKTSMDFSGDWAARQSGTGAGNGARGVAVPGQSTLWRDLASVRESGVLERLTPEECKYQEVRGRGRGEGCIYGHLDLNSSPLYVGESLNAAISY